MVQATTARANQVPEDLKLAGWKAHTKQSGARVYIVNGKGDARTHVYAAADFDRAVEEARELMNGTAKDEPGEMPKDLASLGWKLQEHVGAGKDKFRCFNRRLGNAATDEYVRAQDAIEAARRIQKKHKGKGGNGAAEPTEAEAKREMGELKELYAHRGQPDGTFSILRRFEERHGVKLTAAQVEEKCDALDAALTRKEKIERDFEVVKETFKGDLKTAEAEVEAIEKTLRRREEERNIEVEERLYRAEATVRVVDPASGHIFRERPADLLEMSEHPAEL